MEQIQEAVLSVEDLHQKGHSSMLFDEFNVQGYYILPTFLLKFSTFQGIEDLLSEYGDPVYLYPCKSVNRFKSYSDLYFYRDSEGYHVNWSKREILIPDLVIIDNIDGGDISINITCTNTTIALYCGDRFLYTVQSPSEMRRLLKKREDFAVEAQKWLGLMTAPGWRRSKRKVK
jgi:hypothetical protein